MPNACSNDDPVSARLAQRHAQTLAQKRCVAVTKAGAPCQNSPMRGKTKCNFHLANFASLAGQRGGRRRARFNTDELTPIIAPENAGGVMAVMGQLLVELHGGQLEPRVANAMAYVASTLLSALQVSDFAARLEALETGQKGGNTAWGDSIVV